MSLNTLENIFTAVAFICLFILIPFQFLAKYYVFKSFKKRHENSIKIDTEGMINPASFRKVKSTDFEIPYYAAQLMGLMILFKLKGAYIVFKKFTNIDFNIADVTKSEKIVSVSIAVISLIILISALIGGVIHLVK